VFGSWYSCKHRSTLSGKSIIDAVFMVTGARRDAGPRWERIIPFAWIKTTKKWNRSQLRVPPLAGCKATSFSPCWINRKVTKSDANYSSAVVLYNCRHVGLATSDQKSFPRRLKLLYGIIYYDIKYEDVLTKRRKNIHLEYVLPCYSDQVWKPLSYVY